MNSILKKIILLLAISFVFYACVGKEGDSSGEKNEIKVFATAEDAVNKAKKDLIVLLETNKEINLNIDLEKLRSSDNDRLIKYVEIDFAKLLNTETVNSLSELVSSEKSMVAPLTLNDNVVAVVEVCKKPDGWSIVGLGNQSIREDLNTSRIIANKDASITIYEIPNLHVMVYGVNQDSSELYHLKFQEFGLDDGVSASAFYPELRRSAIQFEKVFGDRLKKERLVK